MTLAEEQADQKRNEPICATAPLGLLAELTHRCPLQCPYCSNPLELDRVNREMDTDVWLDILDQAADLGILQIHFSGGEPTTRQDLEELIERASALGLYSNLITAGVLLSRERFALLIEKGLDHVQLSIQDTDIENAERISGYKNGQPKKVEFARWVREHGCSLTINAPVHRANLDRLEQIISLAVELGADRLEVAHIQYYGWAVKNRAALMPTKEQLKHSIDIVEKARDTYKGIMLIDFVVPDYYASRPKPCMGGWGRSFMCITPSGQVLPCHAAPTVPGLQFEAVQNRSLHDIWLHSDAFNAFRGTDWMPEPCRSCEFKEVDWGGCRCQAFALTGKASNTDPACAKSIHHKDLLEVAESESQSGINSFIYRRM